MHGQLESETLTRNGVPTDTDPNEVKKSELETSGSSSVSPENTSRREFLGIGLATLVLSTGREQGLGWSPQMSSQLSWREDTGIATHPVIFEDSAFGISEDGTVRAHNTQTGADLWRGSLSGAPYPNSIAIVNEKVFAGDETGRVLALDPSTGEQQWQRTLSGAVLGFSTHNNSVVVASSDGLYSINAEDGLVNWTTELDVYSRTRNPKVGTEPLTYGNTIFIRLSESVAAISAETGSVAWRSDVSHYDNNVTQPGGGLTVADGKLFAVGDSLTAYDVQDGSIEWSVESDGGGTFRGDAMVSPVTNGQLVFTGTETLLAVNANDGSIAWQGGGNPYPGDSLTYDQQADTLYLSAMREQARILISLNPDTGTEQWRERIGTASQASRYYYEHTISRAAVSESSVHVACINELVTLQTEQFQVDADETETPPGQIDGNDDNQSEQPSNSVTEETDESDLATDSDTYRGVFSNDPAKDVGTGLGDMFVLTVLSTVLSLFVIIGQLLSRGGK